MVPQASMSKILPLDHNPKIGVYLLSVNSEDQSRNDILFAQFNPKQRLLVTAGSHYVANIWDFRSDDYSNFAPFSSLPHIKGSS
jgi:hypothetical protein